MTLSGVSKCITKERIGRLQIMKSEASTLFSNWTRLFVTNFYSNYIDQVANKTLVFCKLMSECYQQISCFMPSPGQSSCLLNQTSVTRGALSCRKMKRQAQAQVQETATLIKLRGNFNNTTYTTPD